MKEREGEIEIIKKEIMREKSINMTIGSPHLEKHLTQMHLVYITFFRFLLVILHINKSL
jgi:hypothetical protein